uniref:Spt20-like SEP domain-containing protein n=1 Tax=Setaria italica TaxID=4555 RepID=K3XE55_SETIT
MVVSFRLSRRGRRIHPPPPPASTHVTGDSRPHAAASLDVPPPPLPPCEPSFALNLFPDGYSVGEPGKGMLLYLIGDDPKKQPYSRASRALLSDIEHGCLPQDILHGIPCKFQNGSTVCEVRDYRSVFSSGDDYSGDDFPRVNRVHLRLGTDCVVKDLSSIADASWTYHDQLTAESSILNALQPRLNLDPTPCLEMLCNSRAKKIDLGLNTERKHGKDTSVLMMSTNPPENCKTKEFNVCKGATLCIENAALEGKPSGLLNSLSINCPSTIHVNNAKSAAKSDTDNTLQCSSTLPNTSALKQDGSITPPDNLLQSNEERPQVTVSQVDRENRQTQKVTVVPQKRKKSLKLLNERHGSKNHSPPNKSARLSYQNSKGQKSTGSSNKEGFHLGSPKVPQVEVKVGQIIGNKDLKVQEKVPLSVDSSCHPHTSLSTSNLCVKKIPENVKSLDIWSNERHEAPVVDLKISDMADPKGSRIPSVTSLSANSSKAACEPGEDKGATEPQLNALNRKVTEISSISLNQEINLNGERQQKFDIHIECENRSIVEPATTVGVNSKPDIEKILSEVILTTQRHGLNEKAAKSDVLETSWLLPPCEFFQFENVDEIPSMRDETMTYNVSNGATSTWKIRRLTFHPSQYSSCLVDKSLYTLCLLESESLDNQITVGAIYGDEQVHITTLSTSCHAEKFVDQFISLMKRDGYNLCNDEQSEDVSHLGFPTGEDADYLLFSPSAVNSLPIITNNKVGCTIQNKLPDFHAPPLQPLTQQLVLTEQPLTLESPEAFFLNPSHLPGGQQYTGQHLQDQGSSFACNPFATDPLQFPSAQPSQEVSVDQYLQCRDDILGFSDIYSASRYNQLHQEALMDQYLQYRHDLPGFIHTYGMRTAARRYSQWRQEVPMGQYLRYRHDIPWFSDAYGASMTTRSYGQWRQVYTQMGSVVYQWDLPAFGRQIHNSPPLHNGWSIPLSELQPIGSPQMSSRSMDFDGSVTSTPVRIPMHHGYQFPSQELW